MNKVVVYEKLKMNFAKTLSLKFKGMILVLGHFLLSVYMRMIAAPG